MLRLFTSLFAGALFGLGLMISGMTDTAKVQGWLDIFGAWDPTLAFVMGGAIIPMFFAWRFAKSRENAVLGGKMPTMPAPLLDRRLMLGSVMFGAGWAISGFCPGPAMASLSFSGASGLIFFAALIVGMLANRINFGGTREKVAA